MEYLETNKIHQTVGFDMLHFCMLWTAFVTSWLVLAGIIFTLSKGSRELILR